MPGKAKARGATTARARRVRQSSRRSMADAPVEIPSDGEVFSALQYPKAFKLILEIHKAAEGRDKSSVAARSLGWLEAWKAGLDAVECSNVQDVLTLPPPSTAQKSKKRPAPLSALRPADTGKKSRSFYAKKTNAKAAPSPGAKLPPQHEDKAISGPEVSKSPVPSTSKVADEAREEDEDPGDVSVTRGRRGGGRKAALEATKKIRSSTLAAKPRRATRKTANTTKLTASDGNDDDKVTDRDVTMGSPERTVKDVANAPKPNRSEPERPSFFNGQAPPSPVQRPDNETMNVTRASTTGLHTSTPNSLNSTLRNSGTAENGSPPPARPAGLPRESLSSQSGYVTALSMFSSSPTSVPGSRKSGTGIRNGAVGSHPIALETSVNTTVINKTRITAGHDTFSQTTVIETSVSHKGGASQAELSGHNLNHQPFARKVSGGKFDKQKSGIFKAGTAPVPLPQNVATSAVRMPPPVSPSRSDTAYPVSPARMQQTFVRSPPPEPPRSAEKRSPAVTHQLHSSLSKRSGDKDAKAAQHEDSSSGHAVPGVSASVPTRRASPWPDNIIKPPEIAANGKLGSPLREEITPRVPDDIIPGVDGLKLTEKPSQKPPDLPAVPPQGVANGAADATFVVNPPEPAPPVEPVPVVARTETAPEIITKTSGPGSAHAIELHKSKGSAFGDVADAAGNPGGPDSLNVSMSRLTLEKHANPVQTPVPALSLAASEPAIPVSGSVEREKGADRSCPPGYRPPARQAVTKPARHQPPSATARRQEVREERKQFQQSHSKEQPKAAPAVSKPSSATKAPPLYKVPLSSGEKQPKAPQPSSAIKTPQVAHKPTSKPLVPAATPLSLDTGVKPKKGVTPAGKVLINADDTFFVPGPSNPNGIVATQELKNLLNSKKPAVPKTPVVPSLDDLAKKTNQVSSSRGKDTDIVMIDSKKPTSTEKKAPIAQEKVDAPTAQEQKPEPPLDLTFTKAKAPEDTAKVKKVAATEKPAVMAVPLPPLPVVPLPPVLPAVTQPKPVVLPKQNGSVRIHEQADDEDDGSYVDYGLDVQENDETDDEDQPRKQIPLWATSERLKRTIRRQLQTQYQLDEIFQGARPAEKIELHVIFKKMQDRYRRKSSQAWPHGVLPLGLSTPAGSLASGLDENNF